MIALLSLCVFVVAATPVFSQDEFPRIRFGAVMDARFISTDEAESWQNGELGKLRYGGANEERSELARLAQTSLLVSASLSELLSARLQLNVDAEPDPFSGHNPVDLIEGFIGYRPVLSPRVRLRVRAGVFFPPVSMENTGPAWTTPYTITHSAINSWIGEEVRVSGGELSLVLSPQSHELVLTIAGFGNNDPAGSILAWRGWTLNDRQTGFGDRLPLAEIPTIQPGGLFSRQAPYVRPFREIDGRLGYYAGLGWNHRWFEARGIYYNNRGVPTDFDGEQYAWATEFAGAGLALRLPAEVEIIGQFMNGQSRMGPADAVDVGFTSGFILLTGKWGRHRLSARYDSFRVDDNDRFPDLDNNQEDGDAWTGAYLFQTGEKHRLAFEIVRLVSDRPVREALDLPVHEEELQFQMSFRVAW